MNPSRIFHLFFWVFPFASFAQVSQSNTSASGAFNPLDNNSVPARAAAMGYAFTGVADGASALSLNPAGLASLPHPEVSLLTDLGWVGAFRETAVVTLPLGKAGGLGLAAGYMDYGSITGRDSVGSLAPNYGANSLSLQAGWGFSLSPQLALGLELREWQENLADTGYSFFTPEAGLLWTPVPNIRFGVDYAGALWGSWSGSLVSTWRAGASWSGPLDQSTRLLVAVGGLVESNSMDYLQTGLEVSYQSKFFLRGGYQTCVQGSGYQGLSLGAGVILGGLVLDYAYSFEGDLTDYNRVSLSYPFETSLTAARSASAPAGVSPPASVSGSAPSSPVTDGGTSAASAAGTTVFSSLPGGPPPLSQPQPVKGKDDKSRLTVSFSIPSDPTSQGDLLASQGRLPEAAGLYQQALRQDPKDLLAWWGLGNVYYRSGQKKDAITCFEKVLLLKPSDNTLSDWLRHYRAQNPAQ